jgi:Protein of unknown function (DUF3606)
MSEHHDVKKAHEPHAIHEEHAKGPHDPKEINPKLASDIAYWSKEFGVTGDQLHEAIRSHGTHVEKCELLCTLRPYRAALTSCANDQETQG